MKKNFLFIFAIGSGFVFLYESSRFSSTLLWVLGVITISMTTMPLIELLRQKGPPRFVAEEVNRVRFFFKLYREAPVMMAQLQQLQVQRTQLELLERKFSFWQEVQLLSSHSNAVQPQASIETAEPAESGPFRILAHHEDSDSDLKLVLDKVLGQGKANADLIVTDIGSSDLDGENLKAFTEGEIDLDYWIARRYRGISDLLVIPRQLVTDRPELAKSALLILAEKRGSIAVVFNWESAEDLKERIKPASQQTLRVNKKTENRVEII